MIDEKDDPINLDMYRTQDPNEVIIWETINEDIDIVKICKKIFVQFGVSPPSILNPLKRKGKVSLKIPVGGLKPELKEAL